MLIKNNSFKVTISDLLILFFLFYPLVLFILKFLRINNSLVSFFSLIMMSLLSFLMAIFLHFSNKYLPKVLPIVIIFYILNITWFFIRFASLIYDPFTFDGAHVSPQSEDLSLSVSYYFLIN